jgi:hypothetical protein
VTKIQFPDVSHKHLDAIPVFEGCEAHSGGFFLQRIVIVRLDALLLDATLDIFVLFMSRKPVGGIVFYVRLWANQSIAFSCLSNVFPQHRTGAGICFCPQH